MFDPVYILYRIPLYCERNVTFVPAGKASIFVAENNIDNQSRQASVISTFSTVSKGMCKIEAVMTRQGNLHNLVFSCYSRSHYLFAFQAANSDL